MQYLELLNSITSHYKTFIIIFFTILIKKLYFRKKRNLFMCYNDKSKIPQKVYDNLKQYAKGYNIQIYDDEEIIQFFKDHYSDSDRYINKFNTLQGAHKADLWRYCVLYKYGGVYMDIKLNCINGFNLNTIIDEECYPKDIFRKQCGIWQGFLICKPNNFSIQIFFFI